MTCRRSWRHPRSRRHERRAAMPWPTGRTSTSMMRTPAENGAGAADHRLTYTASPQGSIGAWTPLMPGRVEIVGDSGGMAATRPTAATRICSIFCVGHERRRSARARAAAPLCAAAPTNCASAQAHRPGGSGDRAFQQARTRDAACMAGATRAPRAKRSISPAEIEERRNPVAETAPGRAIERERNFEWANEPSRPECRTFRASSWRSAAALVCFSISCCTRCISPVARWSGPRRKRGARDRPC